MIDPKDLIDLAKQIDPTMEDTDQSLMDALLILRAKSLLTPNPAQVARAKKMSTKMKRVRAGKPRPTDAETLEGEGESPNIALGKKLSNFIRRYRLSPSKVSRELDVSTSSVYGWMSGKWHPQGNYQAKIRDLMAKPIEELKPMKRIPQL